MMNQKNYPRVGIGVWVVNDKNQTFLLKRQGSHGAGTWHPPGGKLELGESFLSCIQREVKEETDLDVENFEHIGVTNDIFAPDKHYATIYVKATTWSGEPKNLEPEKSSEAGWFEIHKLPQPLFMPVQQLFESDFLCLCGSGKSFKECPNKRAGTLSS